MQVPTPSGEIIIDLNQVIQGITGLFGFYAAVRVFLSAKKKENVVLLPPVGWLLAGLVASISASSILIYLGVFWIVHDSPGNQTKGSPNQPPLPTPGKCPPSNHDQLPGAADL